MRTLFFAVFFLFTGANSYADTFHLPQHTNMRRGELSSQFTFGSTGWIKDRGRLFDAAKNFFGDVKVSFDAYPATPLYDQFSYAFSGPPENDVIFPDGKILYVADAPNAAKYKGFIVTLGKSDYIVAAGLMRQLCEVDVRRPTGKTCDEDPTLMIYHRKGSNDVLLNNLVRSYFGAYAKHHNAEENQPSSAFIKKIDIRVKSLGS